MNNDHRLRGYNRRFLIQGPGKSFSLGALDLEDARQYVEELTEHEPDWRLWRFCGGKPTIREMTIEEIEKEQISSMFKF